MRSPTLRPRIPDMLKRWITAAAIAVVLMVADVLALIGVTRAFVPAKPPMWATAPFFWVLAWPVRRRQARAAATAQ